MLIEALAAIVFHEAAHILTALGLKVKVKKIGVTWKGPYVQRESGSSRQNFAITLAGPMINLLLATVFRHLDPAFALVNVVLGVFNLLPIPSSDGSRLLSLLLSGELRAPAAPAELNVEKTAPHSNAA
ncbi:MAG TPA: hypothetical protein VGR96_00030 [Acidobacteriaceae bacterium]|nr:hypothetical protein [Acidobacteriaceae bacterium]